MTWLIFHAVGEAVTIGRQRQRTGTLSRRYGLLAHITCSRDGTIETYAYEAGIPLKCDSYLLLLINRSGTLYQLNRIFSVKERPMIEHFNLLFVLVDWKRVIDIARMFFYIFILLSTSWIFSAFSWFLLTLLCTHLIFIIHIRIMLSVSLILTSLTDSLWVLWVPNLICYLRNLRWDNLFCM